jgi:hypothetical protein
MLACLAVASRLRDVGGAPTRNRNRDDAFEYDCERNV